MEKMLDQLGGLGRLVKGKTVAIKINLTGGPNTRLGYLPAGRTYWTHPQTVGAMIHLLDKAGARRIRVLEGATCRMARIRSKSSCTRPVGTSARC